MSKTKVKSSFEDAQLRLRRAKQHLDKFDKECSAFLNSGAYEIIQDVSSEKEGQQVTFTFKVTKEIPREIGLTFGDSIHQMRSACDNLVVQLAQIQKVKNADRLYFPVYYIESKFEKFKNENHLSNNVLAVLEKLQPYKNYINKENASLSGFDHPTHILQRLWNNDKHCQILKVVGVNKQSALNVGGVNVFGASEGSVFFNNVELIDCVVVNQFGHSTKIPNVALGELHSGELIEDGAIILKLDVKDGQPIDDIKVHVIPEIVLGKDEPVAPNMPAHKLLLEMHDYVSREIIGELASCFP